LSATLAGIVLTPRRAHGDADAEALRLIRNACAPYMTGHPQPITAEEQRGFLGRAFVEGWRIWLFDAAWGTPVGFGLIRPVGGRWWATLGLLPEWRGMGHGTAIYRHLIAQCPGDLHIDVLLTNVASARAAERAGFRLVDWNGALATLVARKGERCASR
jgi:GNAT superfamily N-acetyltransferase